MNTKGQICLNAIPPFIQVNPWLSGKDQLAQALEYASSEATAFPYDVQWRAREYGIA
jgi:hypothetical protein